MSEEKRRWQFSIRDVLLITLIVGLAVGWYVDHRRLADELNRKNNFVWLNLGSGDSIRDQTLITLDAVSNPVMLDSEPVQPDPRITDPPATH